MDLTKEAHGAEKRKRADRSSPDVDPPRKSRQKQQPPRQSSLIGPHEAIIAELCPTYNILPVSVISSKQIRKRVGYVTKHLVESNGPPRLALLYARPADVGKMITIAEQVKRVLAEEGKAWAQYNQLFELPPDAKSNGTVEETILEGAEENGEDGDSDSDGGFEVMKSRIESALLPPPPPRTPMSMRIFISVDSIPELVSRKNITVQANKEVTS